MCGPHEQRLHRYCVVKDTEEDPYSHPQTLQNLQDKKFLHEESEIYTEQFFREVNYDSKRFSKVRRYSSILCRSYECSL